MPSHICSKCGWGFTNPHPSSKSRRSHKKVCGKVQGFQLQESQDDDDNEYGNKGEVNMNEEMGSGFIDRQICNKEEELSDVDSEFIESDLKTTTTSSKHKV